MPFRLILSCAIAGMAKIRVTSGKYPSGLVVQIDKTCIASPYQHIWSVASLRVTSMVEE